MRILISMLVLVIGIVSCGSPSHQQPNEPAVPENKGAKKRAELERRLSLMKSYDSLLYNQLIAECDSTLEDLSFLSYIGIYKDADDGHLMRTLTIAHPAHSGDGVFELMDYYSGDSIYFYLGRRYTLRGMPGNNDATIWQFRTESDKVFNYYCADDKTLILLDAEERLTTDTLKKL